MKQRSEGFTLPEALISSAVFSILIAGVFVLYTTMQKTLTHGELMSELQQNARVALDQMTRDIRMAGYDPAGVIPLVPVPPKAPIRAANSRCLSFVADVSGKGTTDQITYDLNGTTLRRRVDKWVGNDFSHSGGAQPLTGSVNSLMLTYYDASNTVLTPSSQGCPPVTEAPAQVIWQMQQIRRVVIVIQTKDWRPGVLPKFYTLTSDVRVRNI